MFHGTDTFVAIISSIGMNGDERQYGLEDRTKISPRKQLLHRPSKYDVITGEGLFLMYLLAELFSCPSSFVIYRMPPKYTKMCEKS